jgi:glycosyltransferase involved in cell wall biosynthesis
VDKLIVGIFKVNAVNDGGSYIDRYLGCILNKDGIDVQCHAFLKEGMVQGYECHHVDYKNPILALRVIGKVIKGRGIAIAYSNQFISLAYLCILKRMLFPKLRVVGKVDGKTIRIGIKKYLYKIYDLFWDLAKIQADFIIFETKNAMAGWQKNNSKVIYTPAVNFYGLDVERLAKIHVPKKIEEMRKDFLSVGIFVGRYSWEKGYEYIGAIAAAFPKILFLTVGGEKNIFSGNINILEMGRMEAKDIIPFYAFSDFLLVPSNDDSFPGVVREYSFFGKPIVATDVGSFNEFKQLGIEILLCKPDIQSLIQGIKKIEEKQPANNNKKIYKQYFDPNAEKIIETYRSIFKYIPAK